MVANPPSHPASRENGAEQAMIRSTPLAETSSANIDKNSSLISRQVEAEAASVDQKIEKLQSLLKMAKNN